MHAELVCTALQLAVAQLRPAPGMLVHSDRGSQYASALHQALLERHGLAGSMSRKGNCWDTQFTIESNADLKICRVNTWSTAFIFRNRLFLINSHPPALAKADVLGDSRREVPHQTLGHFRSSFSLAIVECLIKQAFLDVIQACATHLSHHQFQLCS